MTAADRRMAARRSSPCNLLIIVLHPNREHRRDAYATLGSASCLVGCRVVSPSGNVQTPGPFGARPLRGGPFGPWQDASGQAVAKRCKCPNCRGLQPLFVGTT